MQNIAFSAKLIIAMRKKKRYNNLKKGGRTMQEIKMAPYLNTTCPIEIRRDFVRSLDPNHIHDFLQIFFIKEGFYTHYVNRSAVTLPTGDIAIIPSDCPHHADTRESDNDLFYINISNRLFSHTDPNPWNFRSLCLTPLGNTAHRKYPFLHPRVAAKEEIGKLYEEMFYLTHTTPTPSISILQGKSVEFMSLVASEYAACESKLDGSAMSDYCPSIHAAFRYIHANFRGDLCAENTAKEAMLSLRSFYRLFGGCMGISFHNYVQFLRVNHAETLLRTTNRILPDIAYASGFSDLATFHRIFRCQTGLTPNKYRTAIQNIQ